MRITYCSQKDGLAAGKGVIIANTRDEAIEAVEVLYPQEDGKVVFEQFLEGEEFSLMTFINGDYAVPLTVLLKIINVPMIMTKVLILVGWALIVLFLIFQMTF